MINEPNYLNCVKHRIILKTIELINLHDRRKELIIY